MSRIFLSHSSADDFDVAALRDWLATEGWDDVFLDFDPERGIAAGERWERALHEAATRCEAVIFLVSRSWLASGWCREEYALARRLNKRLFAVLIDPDLTIGNLPDELKGTWQVVNLVRGQEIRRVQARPPGRDEAREVAFAGEGLRRLRRGLAKAGLDPDFFAWPPAGEPGRAPYRGLEPLADVDAGILFGRDAPIVEALDRIRGLAAAAAPRLLVILGASGAGKSSFLRAGLLPRLARDDAHVVPLRPIRPEGAPLMGREGLVRALAEALPGRERDEVARAVDGGAATIRPLLAQLADGVLARRIVGDEAAKPPAVVIAVDQAEELLRGESTEGRRFLEIVRDLTVADSPKVVVLFAIRSDAYDGLEHANALQGLKQNALPLLPMPRAAFKDVIEGPARRVAQSGGKLVVEPALTDRLLADLGSGGGSDMLPLLAFTLEQLFGAHGRAGALRLADYEAFGGLRGAIEAAVGRALARSDRLAGIPPDGAARERLLRRGLIPWLAGIDPDTRAPRRNIARRDEIPADALPLIDLLVDERLLSADTALVRDPVTGAEERVATIEPSHEALLRQWSLLDGWLQEDFALLAGLETVQRSASDWAANGRADAWIAHRGQRLADVAALDERPDIAAKLGPADRAYLARGRTREEEERAETEARRQEREAEQARRVADAEALALADRRTAQRTRTGLAAAIVLALAAGAFGIYAQQQRGAAQTSLAAATSTANTLIVDLAGQFRDVAGMPASLVKSIFDRALGLQDQLIGSGQTSPDLLSSQATGLSDASRTLITVGDVDRSRSLATRSTDIWRSLLKSEPGDPALRANLSRALTSLGDARMLAGDQPGALATFGESLDISRALASGSTDSTRRVALATALQRVGDAKSARGDRAGGLSAYEESLAVYRLVGGSEPSRSVQIDIAHSLDRIGSMRAVMGDPTGAVAAFEESATLRRRVVAATPDNAVAQRDLAWTLGLYGEFKEQAGDRTGALALYEESLALRRAVAQDRSNARAQRDLGVALSRVGLLRRLTGDIAGAESAIAESVSVARDFARDRANTEAQRNLALALQADGDVKAEGSDGAGALKAYSESLAIFRTLAGTRGDETARRDLALILDSIGDLKLGSSDRDGALASYEEALGLKRRRAADSQNVEAQRDLGIGLDKIGDVRLASGDTDAALAVYEESLALFRRLAEGARDPQTRRDLELALNKIGEAKAEAHDRAGALAAYGESLAIARELFRDAAFSTAKRDLAGVLSRIGNLRIEIGDETGALAVLDECLALVVELDRGKTDLRSLQELFSVATQVGQLRLKRSDRPGALTAYEAALDGIRPIARSGEVRGAPERLVTTLSTIGLLRLQAGDKPGALAAFEESLAPARKLAESGAGAARNLGFTLDNVGILRRSLGDLDKAEAAFSESLALRRRLAGSEADGVGQVAIAVSLGHLGEVAIDRKRYGEAFQHYRAALELRKAAMDRGGADAPDDDMMTDVDQVGSIAYHSLFAKSFPQALDAADLAISYAPDTVWLRTNRAHALMFLGRTEEARALYLAYRNRQAQSDQTWEEAVLGDFADFRKAGLASPLMAVIETALSAPRTP